MCNKGPRRGATGNGMQHRRLNLNKLPLNQKLTDTLNRRRTNTKDLTCLWIYNEINITLAIAHLLIHESMVLIGQRSKGLGEQTPLIHVDIEIALTTAM